MGETKTPDDLTTRQRAIELIEAGVGRRRLARELGVSDATARKWARTYAAAGADAIISAGMHRKVYDFETKLAAVKDHLERGKSVREVMIAYQVPSESSVKAWCRAYKVGGPEALVNKRRGRKPKTAGQEDDRVDDNS